MSIKVRYIYSACITVETIDCKILCDPWFTEGAYDGSWFQFPKVKNPLEIIGDVDAIFISHIHPDHYDSKFIKDYFERYGTKKIYIANHKPNYLFYKMMSDNLVPTIINEVEGIQIDKTKIMVFPHKTGSKSDIDSALSVTFNDGKRSHCVLNVNDIIVDESFIKLLNHQCPDIDILLCGYTGAGPYPQTYFPIDDEELIEQAKNKKEQFFTRYTKLIKSLNSKVNIPFAGKYILGGKLVHLNDFRGVADAVEVLKLDNKAVVLDDEGAFIDTENLIPSKVRKEPYSGLAFRKRVNEIKSEKMAYEKLISKDEIKQIPFKRLLQKSYFNALEKSELSKDYFFVLPFNNDLCIMNLNKRKKDIKFLIKQPSSMNFPMPRTEIIIDERYLFGLMTYIYHWDNAQVGSQILFRRHPNKFNRSAQNFLNFFHV